MTVQRTRIKFCGMTREADIDAAVDVGVDAIGLILVAASPRALSVERALELRRRVPPLVDCVVLLRDPDPALVTAVVERLRPDLIQFHGSEPASECRSAGRAYLKALPMGDPDAAMHMLEEHGAAAGFVFDSHGKGGIGGTGTTFDWSLMPEGTQQRVILAGGLEPGNVASAIRSARPFAVDVSSGIESRPGVKSVERMREFVAAVRAADAQIADTGAAQ
jgi:phosphoribosylanthranilate isomerase